MTFVNIMKFKNASKPIPGDSQFQIELSRLNKEAKNELRMHDTEKQQFRKKYSRLDIYNENPITEASEIRMYETHIPGFCYRSNGECRCPPIVMPNVFVDFKDIHAFLFTNGEVDVEKVLCLHMLSTHKIETLTPPPKKYNFFLPKKMFPIERLIERSKKKITGDKFIKNLPTYVIETLPSRANNRQNIDPRLQTKILVNEKLMEIVRTVLTAMQESNKQKYRNILRLSKSERVIRKILLSSKTEQLATFLKSFQLVTSCEAFRLMNPPKRGIREIKSKVCWQIEDLVKYIRRNIFQIPETLSVTLNNKEKENNNKDDLEVNASNDNISFEYELFNQKLDNRENEEYGLDMDKSLIDFCCQDETIVRHIPNVHIMRREARTLHCLKTEENERNKSSNVDSLMLLNVPEQPGRLKYKATEQVEANSEIDDDTDLVKIAESLNAKVKELAKRDRKSTNLFYFDYEEMKENKEMENLTKKPNAKLIRCTACRHKLQNPFPKPKVSQVTKVYIPTLDEETYNEIKTDSLHKISQKIDRTYKSTTMQKKMTHIASTSYRSSSSKGPFIAGYSTEIVQLKDLDLALITQEIKEKEAQKKYTNFFKK